MNMSHQFSETIPPRKLTSKEQSILERLLSSEFKGVHPLRLQLASVKVVEECSDCFSIGLCTDQQESLKAEVKYRVPIEAIGNDVDGVRIHILLHVVNGFMNELELFREDPLNIQKLPSPDTFELLIYD